jgi:iron(III) transport system substrate-binding protein
MTSQFGILEHDRSVLNRRQVLLGVASATALAVPAVVGKARAATIISVYSTTHPPVQAKLAKGFTEKTGITVQSLRLNSSGLGARILAEQKGGQYICDVLTQGNDILLRKMKDDGMLVSLADRPSIKEIDKFWRPDDYFVRITASPQGIAYNPKLVPPELVPTNWNDLAKPEFKGKIMLTDPRNSETTVPFILLLREEFGDDFLRELGKQELRLVPVTQQGVEQVAAGEAWVVIPCNPGDLARYEGQDAPVKLAPTPPRPNWTSYYSAILKTAPNMEGAMAWFDYTMSREGQEILCDNVSVSPLNDVPGSLPKPSGGLKATDIERALKDANEMFDLLGLPA